MKIMIRNADNKAKELTKAQFDVVHDYIVETINKRKTPKDEEIIRMLKEVGDPIDFTTGTVDVPAKKRR